MPIHAKSISEPVADSDGTRLLITRYRPRGVRVGTETWAAWEKRVAPSVALLDAWFGKRREGRRIVERDLAGISWKEFTDRFHEEMADDDARTALAELRARSDRGETITLLCYCDDEAKCHRGLVRDLLG